MKMFFGFFAAIFFTTAAYAAPINLTYEETSTARWPVPTKATTAP